MKSNSSKSLSIKILLIYMISALLFLSSIELHIHTHEAAVTADHGFAVSVTSLPDSLANHQAANEIEVSPDGMLHAHQGAPQMLAIFILLVLIVTRFIPISFARNRKICSISDLPFFGTPALRAPPQ